MRHSWMAMGICAFSAQLYAAEAAKNQSEVTLYGALAYSVWNGYSKGEGSSHDLYTHAARIGIEGQERLGENLAALFNFRFDSQPPTKPDAPSGLNSTRYAYLGLKGDFGKLTLGRQDTFWYDYGSAASVFQDIFDYGWAGLSTASKMIRYEKADIGGSGLTLGASAVLDGKHEAIPDSKGKAVNAYEIGATFDKGPWSLFAGFQHTNSNIIYVRDNDKVREVMGASVTYREGPVYVGFDYEHHASKGDHYALGAIWYKEKRKHHLYGGVEMVDYRDQKKWYQGALGYTYYFSPNTYSWLEGQSWKQDKLHGYDVVLGMRHNF